MCVHGFNIVREINQGIDLKDRYHHPLRIVIPRSLDCIYARGSAINALMCLRTQMQADRHTNIPRHRFKQANPPTYTDSIAFLSLGPVANADYQHVVEFLQW